MLFLCAGARLPGAMTSVLVQGFANLTSQDWLWLYAPPEIQILTQKVSHISCIGFF